MQGATQWHTRFAQAACREHDVETAKAKFEVELFFYVRGSTYSWSRNTGSVRDIAANVQSVEL
jgi:hypothetical protein